MWDHCWNVFNDLYDGNKSFIITPREELMKPRSYDFHYLVQREAGGSKENPYFCCAI